MDVAGGHNDLTAFVAIAFTLFDARKNGEMPIVSLDTLNAFIEPQFEAIVFRSLPVVFERFIPGWFFPSTCKGEVTDFEELGSGEEQHVGRIVVERITEAAIVNNQGTHSGTLSFDGQNESGRTRPHEGNAVDRTHEV